MRPPHSRRRQVLATPGIPSLLCGAVLGRVAYGVLPVAVFLTFLHATSSLKAAALMSAVHGLAGAASFPLKGRVVDRHGRSALYVMSALALFATAACFVVAGVVALFALLLVAAIASPPVTSTVRSSLSSRTSGELSESAFALDAGLEEAAFLVGPALGGLSVATLGTRPSLLAAAALLAIAVVVLAPLQPNNAEAASPGSPRGRLSRGTWFIAGIFTTAALAQGLMAATIAAAARSLHSESLYGVLLSLDGAGSLIGLVVFGRLRLAPRRSIQIMSVLTVLLALPLLAAHSRLPLLLAVTLLGLPVASLAAALNVAVATVERPERRNEAFAVLVTCQNLAGAVGFAVGGAVVGSLGGTAPAVLGVASACLGFGLFTPAIARRLLTPSERAASD